MPLTIGNSYIATRSFCVPSLTEEGEWCQVHVSEAAIMTLIHRGPVAPLPDTDLAIFRLAQCGQSVPMHPSKVAERLQPLAATK